jgi:hypothetical protein
MFEQKIEVFIEEVLSEEAQKNALDFAEYLRTKELTFERGKGYWEDKRYWMIKRSVAWHDEYICFILVNGFGSLMNKDEPKGWIIWFDDWSADFPLDEKIKEIAWENVDLCGHCGGVCDGGVPKKIFGKEFDNVCRTTFRFDNPNDEMVDCMKKMIDSMLD